MSRGESSQYLAGVCPGCNGPLYARYPTRKTCSDACNQRVYRARRGRVTAQTTRGICAHCKAEKHLQARGLCSTCYKDAAIRASYPPRKGRRGHTLPESVSAKMTDEELEAMIAERRPSMPPDKDAQEPPEPWTVPVIRCGRRWNGLYLF